MTAGRTIVSATPIEGHLRLVLNDGSERIVDRAVLATGYKVDIDRNSILDSTLARASAVLTESKAMQRGGFVIHLS
jgi:hypothetical protein